MQRLRSFSDLQGHCGLQMASEVRYDLKFKISDFDYQHQVNGLVPWPSLRWMTREGGGGFMMIH